MGCRSHSYFGANALLRDTALRRRTDIQQERNRKKITMLYKVKPIQSSFFSILQANLSVCAHKEAPPLEHRASTQPSPVFTYAPNFMPTFVTLRLRLPRPGVMAPFAPLPSCAPTTSFSPMTPFIALLGAEGDRPPRDDLTLLLPPLLNGKPTEQMRR